MDSTFERYFGTNNVPPLSEFPQIRAAIASHKQALNDVKKQLQDLIACQTHHKQCIQRYECLLSPIKRIPVDVLSSIFIILARDHHLASRSSASVTTPSILTRGSPQVVVSHVCKQWRDVSLNTGPLWSYIRIAISDFPIRYLAHSNVPPSIAEQHAFWEAQFEEWGRLMERTAVVLETWIARSRECPLRIYFRGSDAAQVTEWGPRNPVPWSLSQFEEKVSAKVSPIVASISRESHRWESITVEMSIKSSTSPLLPLLTIPILQIPCLRDLGFALLMENADGLRSSATRSDILASVTLFRATSLYELRIGGLDIPLDALGVNWSNLTHFAFPGYSSSPTVHLLSHESPIFGPSQALQLLRMCSRLEECALIVKTAFDMDHTFGSVVVQTKPSPPVVLPFLHTLRLEGPHPPAHFGQALYLPSLKTLIVNGYSDFRMEEDNAIVSIIRRHGSQLTNVTFSYMDLSPSALDSCIESLPNVVSLSLIGDIFRTLGFAAYQGSAATELTVSEPYTPALLRKLIPEGLGSTCYCPKLKRLRWVENLDPLDVVDLIASRRTVAPETAVSRLSSIAVKASISSGVDVVARLKEKGVDIEDMSITIKYPPPLNDGGRSESIHLSISPFPILWYPSNDNEGLFD